MSLHGEFRFFACFWGGVSVGTVARLLLQICATICSGLYPIMGMLSPFVNSHSLYVPQIPTEALPEEFFIRTI